MPAAITEEEIRSKLSADDTLAHKLWRTYQIYRKTPKKHRSFRDSGRNFDEWLKGQLPKLDQSKERVSRIYFLLGFFWISYG